MSTAEERFVDRMYKERRRQGMSQAALAAAVTANGAAMHPTAITKLEWGVGNDPRPQRRLTLNEAIAISDTLGVPLRAMYGEPELTERWDERVAPLEKALSRVALIANEALS